MQDKLESALLNYEKSINILRKSNSFREMAEVLLAMGNIQLFKGNYSESMNHYLEGLRICEEIEYKSKLPHYYNNIGIVYMRLHENHKALNYYLQALKIFEKLSDTNNMAMAMGNIASIYSSMNNPEIAKKYFFRSNELYISTGVKVQQSQLLLQIGILYLNNNIPDSAIYYLNESEKILELGDDHYIGPKSLLLVDLYTKYGVAYDQREELSKALYYLTKGYRLGIEANYQGSVKESSGLLSFVYEKLGNSDSALHYYKIYKLYSDSLTNENNIRELTKLEFEYQYEKQLNDQELELQLEKDKRKQQRLTYLIIFSGLILLLVIFFLLLKLERSKKTKIDLQRKQFKSELEYKNKELATHVLYLLKKNEFILSISEKLKTLIPDIKVQNKKEIMDIIRELEQSTSNDIWQEFEIRFKEVHNTFFENLNNVANDLSPNELRLCAFLKLNMTSKDISAITFQTTKSIDMARHRLRKKLALKQDENLITFLTKL